MLFSIWPKRPFFDRLYHDRRCPTSGFGNRMTFSNNPEKLSLFGGGCNGSATFRELFRLVWRTNHGDLRVQFFLTKRGAAGPRIFSAAPRFIPRWPWGSGSFAFAGQTVVDHPAAFRWHASSKKNRPSWCLFPFQMAMVLPLRTAWIADILSQASLRDVERQRCWKRGSGDGQRLWNYFTARLSDLSMPLTSEVRRSPEPSARPSAAADSEERQICTTCLFAESVGLCLCFLPSCAMYKDNAFETW